MKKLFLLVPLIVTIIGCSGSTPNNVELTVKQGVCVTSEYPGYESTPYSVYPNYAFRTNAYTAESSPYCMALTLTNNNSGENANNIQVYQGGLSISYAVESNLYTGYMIDYNAAGISPSYFNYYTNQIIGNMALFDPDNCVTTQGIEVNTLSKEGGKCTFYLQIISESMPVGVYPLNVNVNYTNGNANYSAATTIYQQVGILAGGDFTTPGNKLAVYNGNSQFNAEALSAVLPNWSQILLLARDFTGNVYAYDGNTVYKYDGVNLSSIANSPPNINDLTGDSFGNLFAATQNGVFVYNASAGNNATWSLVAGIPASNIPSLRAESENLQNIVYFTGNGGVESCLYNNGSCNGASQLFSGSNFNNQALAINSTEKQIIWGSQSQVYNGGAPLSISDYAINQSGKIGVDKLGIIYVGSESDLLNPAVFNNIGNLATLSPLVDYSSNALFGKSNGVYLRQTNYRTSSVMSLYSYGERLSSLDLFTDQYLVLLAMNLQQQNSINYYAAKSNWTAINGFNSKVNDVIISSRLSIESKF